MKPRIGGLLILGLALGNLATANVSIRNGNFFIGFADLAYNGGFEPKIERVYNSKSVYDGIFGYGWGSDFEVYLNISADGSVVMHENGGGAHNRFTPPNLSSAEIDRAVENIMAAKAKTGAGVSGSIAAEERKHLRTDARYRNDEWERLYSKGLVEGRKITEGAILKSNKFSYQTLTKTSTGYVRRYETGKVETFDNAGRLRRVTDKNGSFVDLSYDKAGHLVAIKDSLNRTIELAYNREGKVEKANGEGGKECQYRYNGRDLAYAKDSENNVFEYKYSSDKLHNLVEVKYDNKATMQIGYDSVNKGSVIWVKEKDGTLTEYKYGGDGPGGSHFITEVISKGSDGKLISKSRYEYFESSKMDGEHYTKRLVTELDGDKTDTEYSELGLPIAITRNNEKTEFTYDNRGHVVKKVTPTEVTDLAYNNTVGKISKVTKSPKGARAGKKKAQWAEYQYDQKGNLTFARNSEGKTVKIVYDLQGRIKALIDQNKHQLQFTYNEASRPVEIKDPAVGKIQVQYTNAGDIKKVESSGGRTVASHVTSTFQNLLDIIRPAGVSLTF